MSDHLDEELWRTSVEEVRAGSFDTDLDDDEIKEHIDDAALEVEDKLTGGGMSDRRLQKIERELARHAIKFGPETMAASRSVGPVDEDLVGAFDEQGLGATPWGQNVLRLDRTNSFVEDTPGGTFEVF